MLNFFCGLLLFIFAILTSSAGLRVYLTGTAEDAFTSPQPGLLLMGGGVDVDDPVRWFLTRRTGETSSFYGPPVVKITIPTCTLPRRPSPRH